MINEAASVMEIYAMEFTRECGSRWALLAGNFLTLARNIEISSAWPLVFLQN